MLEKPWLSSKTMLSLIAFLQRGNDFLRHHQIRAVAHQHVHFAFGIRHLYSQSARDFVAHAGIPVLHVITARLARAPEFVQVSGHAAGGADHDVRRPVKLLTMPMTSAWVIGGSFTDAVDAIHFFFPLHCEAGDFASGNLSSTLYPVIALLQFLDRHPGVAGERNAACL